jgi:hypothetical protein
MKKHGNKAHDKKSVADDKLFKGVKLQSWFGDGEERYWVLNEGQQAQQERQARRAATQDFGEEPDDSGANAESSRDSEGSQGDINELIVQGIENWKADA